MTTRDENRPDGSPKVDPEKLAKLLDGRLTGTERDEALAQLEGDPDAREAFSDAAAALAELEQSDATAPAPETAKVLELRPQRARVRREIWIAIAAVLVIAAALQLSKRGRAANELPSVDRMVASLPSNVTSSTDDWRTRPWREFRGSGQPITRRGRAVRVGALIVELEALASRGDSAAPGDASQIAALVDEYPGGSSAGDAFRALADTQAVRDVARRREAARAAETLVRANELRLGAWLEAGRIAAGRGDTAFFSGPDTQAALNAARAAAGDDAEARASITELSTLMAAPRRDLGRISVALDTLLRALAN